MSGNRQKVLLGSDSKLIMKLRGDRITLASVFVILKITRHQTLISQKKLNCVDQGI